MSDGFSRVVTLLAVLFAGLALFAMAAGGASAGMVHLRAGDLGAVVIVWAVAAAFFLLSLGFLMPSVSRQMRQGGGDGWSGMALRVAALVALCLLTMAFLMVMTQEGDRVLQIFPRIWLLPSFAVFAPFFCLAYILPGLACRPGLGPKLQALAETVVQALGERRRVTRKGPPVPARRSWPLLKPGPWLRLSITICVGMAAGAWLARDLLDVIPAAAVLEGAQPILMAACLGMSVLLALAVIRAPLSPEGTRVKRVVAKGFAILVLTFLNVMWGTAQPQRIAPVLAEAVLGSERGVQRYRVVSTRAGGSPWGNCEASATVVPLAGGGAAFEVCRIPRDILPRLQPGQEIAFRGRITDYGMIWESVHLP